MSFLKRLFVFVKGIFLPWHMVLIFFVPQVVEHGVMVSPMAN